MFVKTRDYVTVNLGAASHIYIIPEMDSQYGGKSAALVAEFPGRSEPIVLEEASLADDADALLDGSPSAMMKVSKVAIMINDKLEDGTVHFMDLNDILAKAARQQ